MPYYRICPYCRAHLDAGEPCDCQKPNSQAFENPQKESRPGAANTESGKMENGRPTSFSTSMIAKTR